MDADKPPFDFHDAIVLYAAISAGSKGITSQGIVLLSDCVEHARSSGPEIDKSLERLQTSGLLRRSGQAYHASRAATAECGPKIAQHQSIRAGIDEVLQYLLA